MRSIEELRGLVAGVTRVVVQERHHLRHLLLLQLAGPAPRAEARPALVHGAGRRLLRVPGVQCLHRNTGVYCTVLYCSVDCTVLYRCPSTSTSTPSLSTSPPCCSASEAPSSGLPRSAHSCHNLLSQSQLPVLWSGNISDAQLRLCHHHEELGHLLGHIEDLGLDREPGGLLLVPGPGDPGAAHLGAAGRGADLRVGAGHRAAAPPQEVFSRALTSGMSHGCTSVFTILAPLLRQCLGSFCLSVEKGFVDKHPTFK